MDGCRHPTACGFRRVAFPGAYMDGCRHPCGLCRLSFQGAFMDGCRHLKACGFRRLAFKGACMDGCRHLTASPQVLLPECLEQTGQMVLVYVDAARVR